MWEQTFLRTLLSGRRQALQDYSSYLSMYIFHKIGILIILVKTIMHKLHILRHNLMQNFAHYTQNANPFIMYWK